ncbi:MAG: hypothetical protein SGBAC_007570 [Bacillariaceae sp.]
MSSGSVIQVVVLSVALLLFLILFHRRRPPDCNHDSSNNQRGGEEEELQATVRHLRQQLVLRELEEKQQKIKRKITLLQKFHCTTIGEDDCGFNKRSVDINSNNNNSTNININIKHSTDETDSDDDKHQEDVESQMKEPKETIKGTTFTQEETGSGSFFGSALWKNYLQSSVSSQRNECSICLEPYAKGDSICVSKSPECQHMFHKQCIVQWLQTQDHCPLCRVDLMNT